MAIEEIKPTELQSQFIKQVSAFSECMGEQFCQSDDRCMLIIADDKEMMEGNATMHGSEKRLAPSIARVMKADKDFEMLIKKALFLFTLSAN